MGSLIKNRRFLLGLILITLLLLLPTVTLAQDGDDEEPLAHCNPVALRLSETMEVDCEQLLKLLANGHGLGQVMQAVYLVEGAGNLAESASNLAYVEDLLQQKKEQNIGWGQLKMARRLAGEDGKVEELLRLKRDEGLSWGQIKKFEDLVDYMGYEEAIKWLKTDSEWEGEGPPPWAASSKDKIKNGNGNSPPAWSNAVGIDKSEEENDVD